MEEKKKKAYVVKPVEQKVCMYVSFVNIFSLIRCWSSFRFFKLKAGVIDYINASSKKGGRCDCILHVLITGWHHPLVVSRIPRYKSIERD